MGKLSDLREHLNLTQKELSEKSGISIRTIQRIESGQKPKGFTLKAFAITLGVEKSFFDESNAAESLDPDELKWNKIVNMLALPGSFLPPLNVLLPLAIMYLKKQNNRVNKKLVSIQICWTLVALFLFVIVLILNDWLDVKSQFTMLIPILWLMLNTVIITRNAMILGKNNDHILPDINVL